MVVTHQAEKIWMYNRTTVRLHKVLLLTCMVNCTAGTPTPQLCSVVQWSVHWAPSRTTWVLVLAGARRCALETCRGKKMRAPLLGLAKSIYYQFRNGYLKGFTPWVSQSVISQYLSICTPTPPNPTFNW